MKLGFRFAHGPVVAAALSAACFGSSQGGGPVTNAKHVVVQLEIRGMGSISTVGHGTCPSNCLLSDIPEGTDLTVQAIPDPGWTFQQWGNGTGLNASTPVTGNPQTFHVTSANGTNYVIGAFFVSADGGVEGGAGADGGPAVDGGAEASTVLDAAIDGGPCPLNGGGALDPTFGSAGFVSTDFPSGPGQASEALLALDPSGRLVAAGPLDTGSTMGLGIARYLANGTLDPTFNATGLVTSDRTTSVSGVAVQADHKVLVLGRTGSPGIVLLRFGADGSPDGTFGSGGLVANDTDGGLALAFSGLALQPDGQILAVGTEGLGTVSFAVARYNATDGSLDPSFAGGAIWKLQPGQPSVAATAVTVQSDGRIVVAGYSGSDYAHHQYAVFRLNANGTLDTSFGSGGIASFLPAAADAGAAGSWEATRVAMQGDKIVIAGGINSSVQAAVARLNSDGSVDRSFGTGGSTHLLLTGVAGSYSPPNLGLLIQPDGRIVLASETRTNHFDLTRLTADGMLDATFGSGGHRSGSPAGMMVGGWGIAFANCGLVVSGATTDNMGGNGTFALARFLP